MGICIATTQPFSKLDMSATKSGAALSGEPPLVLRQSGESEETVG